MKVAAMVKLTSVPVPDAKKIDLSMYMRVDWIVGIQRVSVQLDEIKDGKKDVKVAPIRQVPGAALEATMVMLVNGSHLLVTETPEQVHKMVNSKRGSFA